MYSWTTAETTHEGFPLFLRRPTNVDTAANRDAFSTLAIITHEFRERLPDGRPASDYNDSLADFDHQAVIAFDATGAGVPVLVETFGGKRNYYFYVLPETDVSGVIARLKASYPLEPVTWETRPDVGWSFLDRYAKVFHQCA